MPMGHASSDSTWVSKGRYGASKQIRDYRRARYAFALGPSWAHANVADASVFKLHAGSGAVWCR
jgi:hypothetical protein